MLLKRVERPRELKWYHAAGLLYGDWGTSKAYVLGIAFALSGHASWFFLGLMSLLVTMIGICYTVICHVYPDGGGVYSSVRSRSQALSVIGALLLVADYVVTAALSSLDAFHYLNVPRPEIWAMVTLIAIGVINWFGPRKSANIAVSIAALAAVTSIVLFAFAVPHVTQAQLHMPVGGLPKNWSSFVGIILALSGVEAVANMTGIMVKPVERTSKFAIWPVLLEVGFVTFLLGLAMNAVPGLTGHTEDMLRALGNHYIGPWYGSLISVIFGFLLISAANTAITGLISIQFLMGKDRELPAFFTRFNRYGVPGLALAVAVMAPVLVLMSNHDLVQLAALYAIGVVGAITLDLGACSTNWRLKLKKHERILLFVAALIMFFIWLTIAVEKRNALMFAATVLLIGFSLRTLGKVFFPIPIPAVVPEANVLTVSEAREIAPLYHGSSLVALKSLNLHLLEEAALRAKALGENSVYLNYVEEIPMHAELPEELEPSAESLELLARAEQEFSKRGLTVVPVWQVGENPGKMIAHAAKELGVNTVMIGATRRSALVNILRGDVIRILASALPKDCHLVISG